MEKIWLKHYPKQIPAEINPEVYTSLNDFFLQCCDKYAVSPAYKNLGYTLNYTQVKHYAHNFASFLQHECHLQKGARVAIMLPNCLQYPIAMFGSLLAGLTVVNINPLYTHYECEAQLNDSGADTIIVLANFANTIEKALPKTSLKRVIVTEIGDMLPTPKRQLVNFVVKHIKKMVPAWNILNTIGFGDALKRGKQHSLQPVDVSHNDIAFLQYTGGTTGVSKGAMLTHRNMLANIEQAHVWIQDVATEGQEVIVTALPLYHIFSLMANCMVFMKLGALNLLITNPRDMDAFVKELQSTKFTAITGVNTLFNGLLHHPDVHDIDFSALRLTLGGGMAVQKSVAEEWHQATGCPLLEAYGLTETSPAVCITPLNRQEYNGSVGLPLPSTEVTIFDDNGNELAIHEEGELAVRGPQVMQGYWQNDVETRKVLREDGWLLTGDIATIDEEGFVRLIERKKDLIIVSGFNVYPNEVEEIIVLHPGVVEAAVVGMVNSGSGERVKAFVVKKEPSLSEKELIAHCREHLTAYKIPKDIEFRDDLPKSNVGKILRRELRDEAELLQQQKKAV